MEEVAQLCRDAASHMFAAVCVNPWHVSLCADLLAESPVAVATVIGFPLGASTTVTKQFEVKQAMSDGAAELDIVMNIGMLKSGLISLGRNTDTPRRPHVCRGWGDQDRNQCGDFDRR